MAYDTDSKVWRTVQSKFTLPTSEPTQFVALLKATEPYYELFGGKEVRLLQNVDHPAQFIQIIDYEISEILRDQPAAARRRPATPGLLASLAFDVPGDNRGRRFPRVEREIARRPRDKPGIRGITPC